MVTTGLQNNNIRRFNLVLCEILNKHLHGNDANIDGHYLIINKFDGSTGSAIYSDSDSEAEDDSSDSEAEDDSSDSEADDSSLVLFTNDYNDYYHQLVSPTIKHSTIRNYKNIIARPDYIRPEIAECIVLPSQHTVAIIKTIWIKIIQRKWKKVYAERKRIIKMRMNYSSLKTREITGKWPQSCNYLPTLYGILHDLKN
jgi:hypothetical protein